MTLILSSLLAQGVRLSLPPAHTSRSGLIYRLVASAHNTKSCTQAKFTSSLDSRDPTLRAGRSIRKSSIHAPCTTRLVLGARTRMHWLVSSGLARIQWLSASGVDALKSFISRTENFHQLTANEKETSPLHRFTASTHGSRLARPATGRPLPASPAMRSRAVSVNWALLVAAHASGQRSVT